MADEKKPEGRQWDIFTGLAVVAGVLAALALASLALAGVEYIRSDSRSDVSILDDPPSRSARVVAYGEAADMLREAEDNIERLLAAELGAELSGRRESRCTDATVAVLSKIRTRLERRARRNPDDSVESRRRNGSCRRNGNGNGGGSRCDRRGDDYPDPLK